MTAHAPAVILAATPDTLARLRARAAAQGAEVLTCRDDREYWTYLPADHCLVRLDTDDDTITYTRVVQGPAPTKETHDGDYPTRRRTPRHVHGRL